MVIAVTFGVNKEFHLLGMVSSLAASAPVLEATCFLYYRCIYRCIYRCSIVVFIVVLGYKTSSLTYWCATVTL